MLWSNMYHCSGSSIFFLMRCYNYFPFHSHKADQHSYSPYSFKKGSPTFSIIIMSIQNICWGGEGGVHSQYTLFKNLKTTMLFQQNYHFIAFIFVRFWGREGVCKRVCFVHLWIWWKKNGQPVSLNNLINFENTCKLAKHVNTLQT